MKKAIWFIKNSLVLDFKFLEVSKWDFIKKIDFLIAKYCLIAKHFFKNFELGSSHVIFSREKIYYDSKFGLAGYQSMLSRHQKLIQLVGITDAKTILDIGANVGFFSKLCRDLFPESVIYAIEPVPQIFKCLQLNFKNDSKTKCFNIGFSDFSGKARMKFYENDSAISAIDNDGNIEVKIETLDNFAMQNEIAKIDILKIDTETFEAHVLRGGLHTLSLVKYLFIEITMENNPNYTMSSLMKLLSGDNYDFQLVGFRNYGDVSEGRMPIMDALLVNNKLL
jgi:FkbM family methyltransferase